MTQNKKKGIAKKALSISLVAAMLATSNVPAWASGFEAVDAEGFAVEEATDLLADVATINPKDTVWKLSATDSTTVTGDKLEYTYTGEAFEPVLQSVTVGEKTYSLGDQGVVFSDYKYKNNTASGTATVTANVTLPDDAEFAGNTVTVTFAIKALSFAQTDVKFPTELVYAPTTEFVKYVQENTSVAGLKKEGAEGVDDGTGDYSITVDKVAPNAGDEVIITVTGINGYKETEYTQKYTVAPKNINDIYVEDIKDQVANNKEITPELTVKYSKDSKTSLTNTDYSVVWIKNKVIGTAEGTMTGTGNYTGSRKLTFNIVGAEDFTDDFKSAIDDENVSDLTYNGKEQRPYDKNIGGLVYGTDFIVNYKNNVNAGIDTAKATFTGLGDYAGLIYVKAFTIGKLDLDELTDKDITVADTKFFKGMETTTSEIKPSLTVSYNGKTLTAGVDYVSNVTTVTGTPGARVVNITITAVDSSLNNFTGSKEVTSKVVSKDITEVTIPTLPAQKYTSDFITINNLTLADGTAFTAGIKDGKESLTSSDYYVASYKDNKKVGTATMVLAGKGDYKGTVTVAFPIVAEETTAIFMYDGTSKSIVGVPDLDYTYEFAKDAAKDGITHVKEKKTIYLVDAKTGAIIPENKYDLVYTANRAVGTATVEAKGKAGYDIYAITTFKINPLVINPGEVEFDAKTDYDYTGEEIKPVVTKDQFEDEDYKLKEGIDYEVTYKDNVNVKDDSKAIVTGKGNYVFGDEKNTGKEQPFDIEAVEITSADIKVDNVEYAGGLEVTPSITVISPKTGKELVENTDYIMDLDDGVNAGVATATIEAVSGNENFTFKGIDSKIEVKFVITKKPLSKCNASVVDGKVVIKNGAITVPATEYTVTDNEDGTFTVKAAEKNYTGTITVAAEKVAATTLRVTDRTTSTVSLAWDEVEGAEGYTIWFRSEYETSVSRKIVQGGDVTTWTQKGLQPGTKYFYTVKAWVKDAEGNYVFSEQSPVQRGTTKPLAAKITAVSATDGKVKVTLAGKAAGAEMYSMCYSKSASFDDFKVGIRTSYTTRTFKNALTAGTYYVRVKSYRDLGNNKRVYGAWSNTMKVVVK